jgi:ArsR family transcriptional regulator
MIGMPVRRKGVCHDLVLPADEAWALETARLLRVLADPTRLSMVWCLKRAAEPVCLCDFTARFDLSQPTVSHHMGKLRSAGLVEAEKRGLWTYYRLRPDLPATTLGLIDALVPDGRGSAPAALMVPCTPDRPADTDRGVVCEPAGNRASPAP